MLLSFFKVKQRKFGLSIRSSTRLENVLEAQLRPDKSSLLAILERPDDESEARASTKILSAIEGSSWRTTSNSRKTRHSPENCLEAKSNGHTAATQTLQ